MKPLIKPPKPTTFRICLNDNWTVGVVVIALILVISSGWLYISDSYRNESFWQVFNLFFWVPLIIAVPFLIWRVPRRVRQIYSRWDSGDFVVGQVTGRFRGTRYVPDSLQYSYTYGGQTYNSSQTIGRRFQPRSTGEVPLIVNPQNPKEVLFVDRYQ